MDFISETGKNFEIVALYKQAGGKKVISAVRVSPEIVTSTKAGFKVDEDVGKAIKKAIESDLRNHIPALEPEKIEYHLHEFIESDEESADGESEHGKVTVFHEPLVF